MIAGDAFCQEYADELDFTYDCPDRFVLNGYFQLAQSSGGFRTWWRDWMGDDSNLDNTHLMRLAGRFSRRVRAHAKAHGIPVIDCKKGDKQHEEAERRLPCPTAKPGVFLITVARATAPVWEVELCPDGRIGDIRRKEPRPWVKHYAFHIWDADWGHVTIRLCGHATFNAQIILNGHEYVAAQARKQKLRFKQEGNCFTEISNVRAFGQIADSLRSEDVIGRLSEVCDRWIYTSCLCFGLDVADQQRTGFKYTYSTYQGEYSRNLTFRDGRRMDLIFQGNIDRIRGFLDLKTLKTIFGYRRRPHRRGAKARQPRFEVVIENPVYDLTVLKVHFDKFSLKIYIPKANAHFGLK